MILELELAILHGSMRWVRGFRHITTVTAAIDGVLGGVPPSSFGPLFAWLVDAVHSLHLLRWRPCSHSPLPPHSLHLFRWRPCSHIDAPPHSLHWLRWRPCSHIDAPPHSLHSLRRRPCSHIPLPPHSLHV